MVQKPLKKISIQSKKTKYRKVLETPKTDTQRVTKNINKNIIDQCETEYKALTKSSVDKKKSKKSKQFKT